MGRKGWTLLSNHGHVLVCLADDPDMRLKDMAASIGITERAVQQIIADLEDAQMITRHKEGRRNRYVVSRDVQFRHPLVAGLRVGEFVDLARSRPRLRQLPQPWAHRPGDADDLERDAL
ncbi:MAG: MarR family transcriptional regulator [Dermatophilaceae bacterium]|nr:MarR family transcriptional regulator [Dermatophilaceae bacterium]NUQ32282.1 MarR family transcriptional regulator [Dermatophilaceae bacterium]NUR81242.1 MarR family transcriptional regulator [Dermatophilaceae bacterium]